MVFLQDGLRKTKPFREYGNAFKDEVYHQYRRCEVRGGRIDSIKYQLQFADYSYK